MLVIFCVTISINS